MLKCPTPHTLPVSLLAPEVIARDSGVLRVFWTSSFLFTVLFDAHRQAGQTSNTLRPAGLPRVLSQHKEEPGLETQ